MSHGYTRINLREIEDSAPEFGFGDYQEARFATTALGGAEVGLSHHRVRPGKRQGFAHRHERTEEVYVVVAGSGRAKLEDDVIDVRPMDAIRVAPAVARTFEAGPDGLELLAFGAHRPDDRGELLFDWWTD